MSEQIGVFIVQILISGVVGFLTAMYKLGKYEEKVNALEKKVDRLENDNRELSRNLTECSTKIDERTQNLASTLTKRKSPLSLTEKGEQLLKSSGSDKFVLDNKDDLVQKIKEKNPKTAYDVQVASREVVESIQNEDRFNSLKDYAYKEGIDLEAIFIVMSLYLRDMALALLGYTMEQLDESDPNNNEKTETKEQKN